MTAVHSSSVTLEDYSTGDMDLSITADKAYSSYIDKLEKQLTKLQAQMASLKASVSSGQTSAKQGKKFRSKAKAGPQQTVPHPAESKLSKKPRPWYCFKCGEDGHIALYCGNEPDPELVEVKQRKLKRRQQAWKNTNTTQV